MWRETDLLVLHVVHWLPAQLHQTVPRLHTCLHATAIGHFEKKLSHGLRVCFCESTWGSIRKKQFPEVFDSLVQTLDVSVYGIVTFSARQPFSISTTMALPVQYLPYIQQTELKRSPHTHTVTHSHTRTQTHPTRMSRVFIGGSL